MWPPPQSLYRPVAPGVYVRDGGPEWTVPSFLVLDVDGVLLDVSASYPQAVALAVRAFCLHQLSVEASPYAAEHATLWKDAGGFNDDWDLAASVCLFLADRWEAGQWPVSLEDQRRFTEAVAAAGGGLQAVRALCQALRVAWQPDAIARWCMEFYGGRDGCPSMFGFRFEGGGPGLWHAEQPCVQPSTLERWRGRAAIFTGRNRGELAFALDRTGLGDFFAAEQCYTSDDGPGKPNPEGLCRLLAGLPPSEVLFVGDGVDDHEAARRYNARAGATTCRFAAVVGSNAEQRSGRFITEGADWLCTGVSALLQVLERG